MDFETAGTIVYRNDNQVAETEGSITGAPVLPGGLQDRLTSCLPKSGKRRPAASDFGVGPPPLSGS